MDKPCESVSVILPYFNRVDSLGDAAISVLSQTHSHLVLYMVNDGSTDGSRDVAHALHDSRIAHIDSPVNVGQAAARNLGLEVAGTALVAHMDSDDKWLPDKLEKQIRNLRERQKHGERISVLGCGWRYRGKEGPTTKFEAGPFSRLEAFRGIRGTGTPLLLIDRATAEVDVRFDPTFPALVERDYIIRCLSNGSLVGVLPEVLAVVSRGRSDHVANPVRASAAWEVYLQKYADELSSQDELRSWFHFRAAREHIIAGQRRRARVHYLHGLRNNTVRRLVHLSLGEMTGSKGFALAQRRLPL
jgi:glycosyltransferase involved in cell wall biosynthesis